MVTKKAFGTYIKKKELKHGNFIALKENSFRLSWLIHSRSLLYYINTYIVKSLFSLIRYCVLWNKPYIFSAFVFVFGVVNHATLLHSFPRVCCKSPKTGPSRLTTWLICSQLFTIFQSEIWIRCIINLHFYFGSNMHELIIFMSFKFC